MDNIAATPETVFSDIVFNSKPEATAFIMGNESNPQLNGLAKFYSTPYDGIIVEVEVFGLPNYKTPDSSDFYGIHIHEYGDCTLPFDNTGNHYSPNSMPHPMHEGDMPPIMGCEGYAWTAFYNNRITIPQIIGKSIVIHNMPDDFMTQPSGNSGEKIGCGVIQ